jgi:hypothetical protein
VFFIAFLDCVLQVFSKRIFFAWGDEQDFLLGQSVASQLASVEYSVRASFFSSIMWLFLILPWFIFEALLYRKNP